MTLGVTTSISSLLQYNCRYTERAMTAKPAGTRVQLSYADRKEICELAKSNTDLTQAPLTRLASEKLGKNLVRSTVTGVLEQSDKWLKCADSSASKQIKHKKPQFQKLEAALIERFGQIRAKGGLIIDKVLVEKAPALAELLGDHQFKASDGWLANLQNTADFWHAVH